MPTSSISFASVAKHSRPHSSRRIAWWLFAAFQFFYLLTSSGRVRTPDEYNTLYTTESLVLHGSTAVPQAVELHNFYGRRDLNGQPRAASVADADGMVVRPHGWGGFGRFDDGFG